MSWVSGRAHVPEADLSEPDKLLEITVDLPGIRGRGKLWRAGADANATACSRGPDRRPFQLFCARRMRKLFSIFRLCAMPIGKGSSTPSPALHGLAPPPSLEFQRSSLPW